MKSIEEVNPFMSEQFIQVMILNKKEKMVPLQEIPSGDEINDHPEIYGITIPFLIDKQNKVSIYKDTNFLDVKLNLSDVGLKLLIYISETLDWNQDCIMFNTVKRNNFMNRTNIKSMTTVYKGIEELCRYRFIAPDFKRGKYWINPFRFFYGNRLEKYKNNLKHI